jgi:RNA polymerase sigma factor (sigma-70 family)
MNAAKSKDTPQILELIRSAQSGNSRAEDKLIVIYAPYVNFMVRRYSKKTEIKEDDDLRSYIQLGLLDGIRKFNPKKDTKFIYFAHIWMKKNIFLGEAAYRFIRVPVNQKVYYDTYLKERAAEALLDADHSSMHSQKFMVLENTKTEFFTDLVTYDLESGLQELPEHLLHQTNIKTFNENEETLSLDVLKSNIQQVLTNFNEKEIYIIEHLYGLNGRELLSSEEIAANLKVTKVNITFTKTRIIRMLRHSSLSNKILNGI